MEVWLVIDFSNIPVIVEFQGGNTLRTIVNDYFGIPVLVEFQGGNILRTIVSGFFYVPGHARYILGTIVIERNSVTENFGVEKGAIGLDVSLKNLHGVIRILSVWFLKS